MYAEMKSLLLLEVFTFSVYGFSVLQNVSLELKVVIQCFQVNIQLFDDESRPSTEIKHCSSTPLSRTLKFTRNGAPCHVSRQGTN